MARVPGGGGFVPQEQLNPGSPVTFGANTITPMEDVVSDDIENVSKAQARASEIAYAIQSDFDDTRANELALEFSRESMDIRNNYTTLEGKNAIGTVRIDPETDLPITVYDEEMGKINALVEKYIGMGDNKNQKEILKAKLTSDALLHQNAMSKHSITQLKLFKEKNLEASVNSNAVKTGLEADDWRLGIQIDGVEPKDKESNYWTRRIAALNEFEKLADSKGLGKGDPNAEPPTFDSDARLEGRQKIITAIHDSAISKFLTEGRYTEAYEYYTYFQGEGEIPVALSVKHIENIKTGYNSEKSTKIVDSLFTESDLTSNNFTSSFNYINGLSSSHVITDGVGTVKNGLHSQNGVLLEATDITGSQEALQAQVNQSKFHQEDGSYNLGAGHLTPLTYLTAKFGDVKKADAIFTKAKSELIASGVEFDAQKYKTDSQYANEWNKQLLTKVSEISAVELKKKFGDSDYGDKVVKELNHMVGIINSDRTGTVFTIDAESGVGNKNEMANFLRDTIDDPALLELALTELDSKHKEKVAAADIEYKNLYAKLEKIAYEKPGNWKEILKQDPAAWNALKKEDKKKLMKGPAKVDDVDLLINLIENPNLLFIGTPDNPGFEQYRGDLTEETYLEMYNDIVSGKIGKGSGSGSGSISVDTDLLNIKLNDYKLTDIMNKKNDKYKNDYYQILVAWRDQVEDEKKQGKTVDREKKALILDSILMNTVQVGKGPFNRLGTTYVVAAVDQDQLSKTFSIVKNQNGQFEQVYHNLIPDAVRTYMLKGFDKNGLKLSYQEMTERWVNLGRPKTVIDLENEVRYQRGEIGKITKTEKRFNFF